MFSRGLSGIFVVTLAVLLTSVGCVQALGDFETRADASVSDNPDGGVASAGDGGDSGVTGPCMSGAKECKAQDLMVCNGSGVLQCACSGNACWWDS